MPHSISGTIGLLLLLLLAAAAPAAAQTHQAFYGDVHLHAGNERTRWHQENDDPNGPPVWKHSFLPVYETLSLCVERGLDSCTQTPHGNEVTDGALDNAAYWYGWVSDPNGVGFWVEETNQSGEPYPGGPYLTERHPDGWRLLSDPNVFTRSERAWFDDVIAQFNADHPGFVASPGLEQMALGGHKTWHCPTTPQRCHSFSLGADCKPKPGGGATKAYAYARSLGCAVFAAHPQSPASVTNFTPIGQDPNFGFHPQDVTGYELQTDSENGEIIGLFGPPVSGLHGLSLAGALDAGYPLGAAYGSDMHFTPTQYPDFTHLGTLAQTGYWALQNTLGERILAFQERRFWYTKQFQPLRVEATLGAPTGVPDAIVGGFLNLAPGESFWLRVEVGAAKTPQPDDTTWLSILHNGQSLFHCTKAAPTADCECLSGNTCTFLREVTPADLPDPAGWLMVVTGDGTTVDPSDPNSIASNTPDVKGIAVGPFLNWGAFSPFFSAPGPVFPYATPRPAADGSAR